MDTTVITFRCPDSVIATLDKVARKRGYTRSDTLRLAILLLAEKEGIKP